MWFLSLRIFSASPLFGSHTNPRSDRRTLFCCSNFYFGVNIQKPDNRQWRSANHGGVRRGMTVNIVARLKEERFVLTQKVRSSLYSFRESMFQYSTLSWSCDFCIFPKYIHRRSCASVLCM